MLLILVLGGLATALVSVTGSGYLEQRQSRDEMHAFYVAEAGLSESFAALRTNGVGAIDDYDTPQTYGSGTFEIDFLDGRDDATLGFDRLRLVSTGREGRESSRVMVMARRVPNGDFSFGVFGSEAVTLASQCFIDSYNSVDGAYAPEGDHVNDYGSVGSNGDISIDSNVEIYGDVTPGPDGIVDDNAPQTVISGSTEPARDLEEMPAINVPVLGMSAAMTVGVDTAISAGSYHYPSLSVQSGATLTLRGPATLVLDSMQLQSNSELIIDATNGPIEIFVTGDFDLRSNSIVQTISNRSRDISIKVTTDTSVPGNTVALNSNCDFVGSIYAPNAEVTIESNFRVFGAVKAEMVHLASNSRVHFDEDLMFDDLEHADLERIAWRIVSEYQDL